VRGVLLVAALMAVACSAAFGQGGAPGAFLNYAIAPRSLGMGKALRQSPTMSRPAISTRPGCSSSTRRK